MASCTSILSRRGLALLAGLLVAFLLITLPSASDSTHLRALRSSLQDKTDYFRQAAVAAYRPAFDETRQGQDALVSTKAAAPPSVPTAAYGETDNTGTGPDQAALRAHLEFSHSPHGAASHSPTMYFSHIYAVSSASVSKQEAHERRRRMQQMAVALGLELTWVDAMSPEDTLVKWIAERVHQVRALKTKHLSDALHQPSSSIGGSRAWLQPSVTLQQIAFPDNAISPKWQQSVNIQPELGSIPLPPLQDYYDSLNWVEFLHAFTGSSVNRLQPEDSQLDVDALLRDAQEDEAEQVSAETIAAWHTHSSLTRLMIKNQDTSALVLSDDVDLEWDFERIWLAMHAQLPEDDVKDQVPWQMVFLGHDSDVEQINPAYLHPLLHHAAAPRGMYAYALSQTGYTELSRVLSDPWVAYQSPVDTAITTFSQAAALGVFSVDPPIAARLPSELALYRPTEATTRSGLAESTMERLWRAQGLRLPDLALQKPARNTSAYKFSSPRHPSGGRHGSGGAAARIGREPKPRSPTMRGRERGAKKQLE